MQLDQESSRCLAISRSPGTQRSSGIRLYLGVGSGGQPTWQLPSPSSFPMLLTSSPGRFCMWTEGRLHAWASGGIKEIRRSNPVAKWLGPPLSGKQACRLFILPVLSITSLTVGEMNLDGMQELLAAASAEGRGCVAR